MNDYDKGFNDAIDKVLIYSQQHIDSYENIIKECRKISINHNKYQDIKAALKDFKDYLEQMFNGYHVICAICKKSHFGKQIYNSKIKDYVCLDCMESDK